MKNAYEIRGDVTAIFIEFKGIKLETIIDTKDLERVREFKFSWTVKRANGNGSFYVKGYTKVEHKKYSTIKLHNWIMQNKPGTMVDHINHNTLDNRSSCNLRETTRQQNSENRKGARSDSKSGIRGVRWLPNLNKWIAKVIRNKLVVFSGYYDTAAEAEREVRKARAKFMPYSTDSREIDASDITIKIPIKKITKRSGTKGITWIIRKQRWAVRTTKDKHLVFVGTFRTVEEAKTALIAFKEASSM